MEYAVYVQLRGGYLPTTDIYEADNLVDARHHASWLRRLLSQDGEKFVVDTPLKQFTARKFNTLYGGGAWVYGHWPEIGEEIVISGWK